MSLPGRYFAIVIVLKFAHLPPAGILRCDRLEIKKNPDRKLDLER